MVTAEVVVSLKKGVADPEGANTKKTLGLLGFGDVNEVKFSKLFTIELGDIPEDQARAQVTEMCEKLLANPVIQYYSISIKTP